MNSSSGLKGAGRKAENRGVRPPFFQGAVDGGQELLVIDGFLEESIGAGFQGLVAVNRCIASGHDDNRNVSQVHLGPQPGHGQIRAE